MPLDRKSSSRPCPFGPGAYPEGSQSRGRERPANDGVVPVGRHLHPQNRGPDVTHPAAAAAFVPGPGEFVSRREIPASPSYVEGRVLPPGFGPWVVSVRWGHGLHPGLGGGRRGEVEWDAERPPGRSGSAPTTSFRLRVTVGASTATPSPPRWSRTRGFDPGGHSRNGRIEWPCGGYDLEPFEVDAVNERLVSQRPRHERGHACHDVRGRSTDLRGPPSLGVGRFTRAVGSEPQATALRGAWPRKPRARIPG